MRSEKACFWEATCLLVFVQLIWRFWLRNVKTHPSNESAKLCSTLNASVHSAKTKLFITESNHQGQEGQERKKFSSIGFIVQINQWANLSKRKKNQEKCHVAFRHDTLVWRYPLSLHHVLSILIWGRNSEIMNNFPRGTLKFAVREWNPTLRKQVPKMRLQACPVLERTLKYPLLPQSLNWRHAGLTFKSQFFRRVFAIMKTCIRLLMDHRL